MEKVRWHGPMEENIKDNSKMIWEMVLEYMNGVMDENLKGIGRMISRMVKVYTLQKITKESKVFGIMEREFNNSMI